MTWPLMWASSAAQLVADAVSREQAKAERWVQQCQLAERARDAALTQARVFELEAQSQRLIAQQAQETIALLTTTVKDYNERYESLLDKFTRLRVAGAALEAPPLPLPEPPDELESAVERVTKGLPYEVQMAAMHQLAQDRIAIAAGFATEQDVLARINSGFSSDGIPG